MPKTFQINITGQVQGVGFRPFVYSLARRHKLKGQVFNSELGVLIRCNASERQVETFLDDLSTEMPSIAHVLAIKVIEIGPCEFKDFQIVTSKKEGRLNLPLTPDFAICSQCKSDIVDAANRRFRYAFTTCVQCGPRYAITNEFPFEREHTSLSNFTMCKICRKEYTDPDNRRFHSQTNSCHNCGIILELADAKGNKATRAGSNEIDTAAAMILEGHILAIKNINGYLLCCDAENPRAIARLRKRKNRPGKPFAILYPSIAALKLDFTIAPEAEEALLSPVAPIVILPVIKTPRRLAVDLIAPKLRNLGVMVPSTPLLELLAKTVGRPMVTTSGNIHGSPILSEKEEVVQKLAPVADFFLHHNLNIQFPQDDSVVTFSRHHRLILRRSRGMSPNYFGFTHTKDSPILAMGAQLKSTFALVPDEHAYVSQYFGNLDNWEVFERYSTTIRKYIALFEAVPKIILTDLHPQYQSSLYGKQLAAEFGAKAIEIQHHKAHFSSVLSENELFGSAEKILGVIWDGTGWGEDLAIWGGEFFSYGNQKMERISHFEYFDWLANDKMAMEPRLSLLALSEPNVWDSVRPKFSVMEWQVYLKLLHNNTLKTSSVGRIFDAVAALLDLTDTNSYEAEAAMLMESLANTIRGTAYINFLEGVQYDKVPSKLLMARIFEASAEKLPKEQIAASFLHTLAHCIIQIARNHQFKTIACSGGVFQNGFLIDQLQMLTNENGINLNINRKLSSNDENISFGQLAYFTHIKT